MDDFYIRVYIDEDFEKAIILGFTTREKLMETPALKKMPLKGKSENALYLAKPLTARIPLSRLNEFVF